MAAAIAGKRELGEVKNVRVTEKGRATQRVMEEPERTCGERVKNE